MWPQAKPPSSAMASVTRANCPSHRLSSRVPFCQDQAAPLGSHTALRMVVGPFGASSHTAIYMPASQVHYPPSHCTTVSRLLVACSTPAMPPPCRDAVSLHASLAHIVAFLQPMRIHSQVCKSTKGWETTPATAGLALLRTVSQPRVSPCTHARQHVQGAAALQERAGAAAGAPAASAAHGTSCRTANWLNTYCADLTPRASRRRCLPAWHRRCRRCRSAACQVRHAFQPPSAANLLCLFACPFLPH